MGLAELFNWTATSSDTEIPNIYPFAIAEKDFVGIDVVNIYSRILTDTLERTQGIAEDQRTLFWDNCVASESPEGLVTMLSKAMFDKKELYIVYDKALKLIRKADANEETQIRADYKERGESKVGVYISFKNYTRTDMIKIYSALEYSTVYSLSKNMNVAKAIQLKLTDLRGSVGLKDSADAKAQAVAIATGLGEGRDVLLDAKDSIETAKPDLTATTASMEFINEKRSLYLGLPASYITDSKINGLGGDSGNADAKLVERGLKGYYFSIIKPVIEAIFGSKTTFKSEDFQQISSSLEALKTFELTSDELLSKDNKRIIINKLLGLPEDEKGDAPKKELPDPSVPPVKAGPPKV